MASDVSSQERPAPEPRNTRTATSPAAAVTPRASFTARTPPSSPDPTSTCAPENASGESATAQRPSRGSNPRGGSWRVSCSKSKRRTPSAAAKSAGAPLTDDNSVHDSDHSANPQTTTRLRGSCTRGHLPRFVPCQLADKRVSRRLHDVHVHKLTGRVASRGKDRGLEVGGLAGEPPFAASRRAFDQHLDSPTAPARAPLRRNLLLKRDHGSQPPLLFLVRDGFRPARGTS